MGWPKRGEPFSSSRSLHWQQSPLACTTNWGSCFGKRPGPHPPEVLTLEGPRPAQEELPGFPQGKNFLAPSEAGIFVGCFGLPKGSGLGTGWGSRSPSHLRERVDWSEVCQRPGRQQSCVFFVLHSFRDLTEHPLLCWEQCRRACSLEGEIKRGGTQAGSIC